MTKPLEHLYRFRPIKRLLGQDCESELEGTYIFFASPQDLNDPLEGHRECVWTGDHVIWENFFKHYIECIFIRNMQYFSGNFETSQFPIFPHFNEITKEHAESIKKTIYEFIKHKNTKKLIGYLSSKKTIYNRELLLHLRSMHMFALYIVSKVLVTENLIPAGYGINGESPGKLLAVSNKLLHTLQNRNNSTNDKIFDQTMISALQSIDFADGYLRFKQGESPNWMRLCIYSPEEFLQSRMRLTSSNWFVSCFMEDCFDSSIWGSYGQNHQGVCLKFKVAHIADKPTISLYIPSTKPSGIKWLTQKDFIFQKVNYKTKSPELDVFTNLSAYPEEDLIEKWYTNEKGEKSLRMQEVFGDVNKWRSSHNLNDMLSLTTKTRHWATEQEYRLILKPGFHSQTAPQDRALQYNFNDLEGIIFGIKTQNHEKYQIMQTVEKICKIRNRESFTFYQAYYCDINDNIQHHPIAYTTLKNGITHHNF